MEKSRIKELSIIAAKARILGLNAVYESQSGHIGGSFSAMEILTLLYFETLKADPSKPDDPNRDRFVLSKGHCTPGLYSILAMRGYFPLEDLLLFRSIKGHMSGHAEMRHVRGSICPPARWGRAFPPLWEWLWPVMRIKGLPGMVAAGRRGIGGRPDLGGGALRGQV